MWIKRHYGRCKKHNTSRTLAMLSFIRKYIEQKLNGDCFCAGTIQSVANTCVHCMTVAHFLLVAQTTEMNYSLSRDVCSDHASNFLSSTSIFYGFPLGFVTIICDDTNDSGYCAHFIIRKYFTLAVFFQYVFNSIDKLSVLICPLGLILW